MRTNFVTPVRVVGDDYKGFAYPVNIVQPFKPTIDQLVTGYSSSDLVIFTKD